MRKRFRYSLSAVLLILIIFGLCEAARYSYYGELMPNTYYAKISGNIVSRFAAAKDQLLLLFRKDAFYLYLLLLFIGWRPSFEALSRRDAGFTELIPSAPFIVLGLLAYWGYVGGDIYYERFLLILIPLSYVHLMIEARQFQSSKRTAVLLLLLIIMLQFKPFRHDERFDYRLKKYDRWIELGEFLGEKYPKALLAVDAAGKVPFFSKLRTIDMLGLNDKHIARVSMKEAGFTRHKYDADYVLLREPDLIAAWGTDNLDLSWGITREKYRQKGYALKYVLNSAPESRPQNIIDVSGMGEDEIKVLFNKKYKFFVLGRKPD